jgi:hypothetical protein
MKRSEIVWCYEAARSTLIARIEDRHGREWNATIREDTASPQPRFVTTLICRDEARLLSVVTPSSFKEAQEWCYQQLELE